MTSSWLSFRSTDGLDVIIKETPSKRATFLSFIAKAQAHHLDFLPITWDAGRDLVGSGATSRVDEAVIDLTTNFAFKRSNRTKTEQEVFEAFEKEVAILAHPAVREHPYITQLQGICFDISADDDVPWPALAFEKTNLRDLHHFIPSPMGQELDFADRLSLCKDIGTALMDMHSINIVHGDIKPENVLVFPAETRKFTVQLADFGYSTRYMSENDEIRLPISRPWNAPEVDRTNRSWTPSEAKQADLFSFALLCTWVLFEPRLSSEYDVFAASETSVQNIFPCEDRAKEIFFQKKPRIQAAALELLSLHRGLDEAINTSLEQFLTSCLSTDPHERQASLAGFLHRRFVGRANGFKESIDEHAPDVDNFQTINLGPSILELYRCDYRVRRHLGQQILQAYKDDSSYSLQAAFCYLVGFGMPRDIEKAEHILDTIGVSVEQIKAMLRSRQPKKQPSLLRKLNKLMHIGSTYLSDIYLAQNRIADAEAWFLREMADLQMFLPGDQLFTPMVRNSLVGIYVQQRRVNEVEGLLLPLLSRGWSVVEPEQWEDDIYYTIGQLSAVYLAQYRWNEASEMAKQGVEMAKQRYGEDHIATFDRRAHLAAIALDRGRYEDAKQIFQEIIQKAMTKIGPEHPMTLIWRSNMAKIYELQGLLAQAEELGAELVQLKSKSLGQDHPLTLTSIIHLATTWDQMGRSEEARRLAEHVLKSSRKVMGEDHPDTLDFKHHLVTIYSTLGCYAEAETLQRDILKRNREALGNEHPETWKSMNNLAVICYSQGQLEESLQLLREHVSGSKAFYGKEHPDYMSSAANLALMMRLNGQLNEAVQLESEVLEAKNTVLGTEHPETLVSMNNVAVSRLWQGRRAEAIALMQHCLRVKQRTLGASHPETVTISKNLEQVYDSSNRLLEE